MNKKLQKMVGVVYAAMAMLSVGIMVIIGTITGSWDNLWLIPFGAMILATVFSMVIGVVGKGDDKKK